ncbi:unnamed protein product [Blepharisma stoltei]|uniref:Protein kinase domain-containing protein n=1 Tax=Blepharisma stoltei TaxID=1481888 RepID=A0AAU9IXN4_9CILI|nr:unnamed protein product [Blepharisma stoltei]
MERYKVIKNLGDGTYGSVSKAVIKDTGEIVAIKKMKKKFYSWEECLELREIKVLRKITHPNIVRLKEVIRANDELHLVFEYCEKNIIQMMNELSSPMTELQIKDLILQVLNGLSELHRKGFFHRDMKPDNILVNEGTYKIADFGLAREIRSQPPYTDYVATRWYRAPEILLHSRRYNYQVDLFAVGCIMAELYLMRPLFPGANEADQLNRICSVLGTPTDWGEGQRLAVLMNYSFPQYVKIPLQNIIPNASPDAINFIESLLLWDSSLRSNAEQCLQHPFFGIIKSPPSPTMRMDSLSPVRPAKLANNESPVNERSFIRLESMSQNNDSRISPLSFGRGKTNGENLRQVGANLISRPIGNIGNIGMGRHRF